MARATLVSCFVSVLHYYPCADLLQPATLLRLDVAADSATHISIPFDIHVAIFLALNTRRNILASAQQLNSRVQDFDRHVLRCIHVVSIDVDVVLPSRTLGRFGFEPIR